eukprot:1513914-Amphidinium_carterae.1
MPVRLSSEASCATAADPRLWPGANTCKASQLSQGLVTLMKTLPTTCEVRQPSGGAPSKFTCGCGLGSRLSA